MISFAKYSGAGNDFLLLPESELGDSRPAVTARRMCDRRAGVGADGMILVRGLGSGRFRLRFLNPDGSEFGTCGNGSRCAARYLVDRERAEARHVLVTGGGEIQAEVGGDEVALLYRVPAGIRSRHTVQTDRGELEGWLVHLGTPHFVVPMEELPDGPIDSLCRPLRHLDALGPEGANVDLVALSEPGLGAIRTFERGVEGETLACGSGAMAATYLLHDRGLAGRHLTLRTRSGKRLGVALLTGIPAPGDGRAAIRLTGPATPVFAGRFPLRGDG